MKILITGSRGFVGGSVGRFAARAGHQVLGLGRSSQPEVDWPGDYLQADVANADLSKIINDFAPEVILHAAGTASVSASFEAPLEDLRASALTWANTLEGVRRSVVRPLVFFPSSAAVYGNPAQLPVTESAHICPISPYGFHKAACELLAREYAACFDLQIIVGRIFSLLGPAQRRLLVWELYRQLAGPEHVVRLQGTGAESRDYLHVDDLASALLRLAGRRAQLLDINSCLHVNIASGEETKAGDVARQLIELVAPEKTIECRNLERTGDPHCWRADTSLLRSLTGGSWQPRPLSASLRECVAAWQGED